MTEERKRKKRSEKLSDSFVARLSREIGPSNRLDAIAGDVARALVAIRRIFRKRLHALSALSRIRTDPRQLPCLRHGNLILSVIPGAAMSS